MKDVTDKGALEQGFLRQLWFSLSASFHQCCTLFNSFSKDTIWPYQITVSLNNTQNTSQTCPSNLSYVSLHYHSFKVEKFSTYSESTLSLLASYYDFSFCFCFF